MFRADLWLHIYILSMINAHFFAGYGGVDVGVSTLREKNMKAVLHTGYGPPEELKLAEVEKPVPRDNEILIRIHATTVTTSDCNIRNLTFVPKSLAPLIRLKFGIRKPKNKVIGFDLAGDVEAIGKAVTRFNTGDRVFGTTEPAYGAHAEYICLPEDGVLAEKPTNLTYEEAAAIPVIANTALHFIRDLGGIRAGQKVLINGASGGIGTYAVQLAKHYGAEVTGVCSTTNVELVKSLGADKIIDYTAEDFAASASHESGGIYDVVFDAVGKSSYSRCKALLREKGIYLATLPKLAVLLQMMWTSKSAAKKVKMEGAPAKVDNLVYLRELAQAGTLIPVIDRRYPLERIAEAFKYVEQGHKKGNVVINVVQDS